MAEAVEPRGCGMGAKHKGKPGGSTHRLIAVGEIESLPAGCELIKVGSSRVCVAVASEGRLQVIDKEKEDVGARGRGILGTSHSQS